MAAATLAMRIVDSRRNAFIVESSSFSLFSFSFFSFFSLFSSFFCRWIMVAVAVAFAIAVAVVQPRHSDSAMCCLRLKCPGLGSICQCEADDDLFTGPRPPGNQ